MDSDLVETVETIMLGDMSKVESVVRDNLSYCKQYAAGPSAKAAWESWLSSLPVKLTEGECNHHYSVVLAHYVEVDVDWEPAEPLRICGGDKVRVRAAPADRYRLQPGGPWITVDGNTDVSTAGSETHPCNTDGCFRRTIGYSISVQRRRYNHHSGWFRRNVYRTCMMVSLRME